MDIYHVWCDLKPGVSDVTFSEQVAGRREPTEGFHFGVNSLVAKAVFGLYRDCPDTFRHQGEERF